MHSIGLTDDEKKPGHSEALDRLLTPDEAAGYLRLSISTLARMRIAGNGPAFVRLSPQRVAYQLSTLISYCADRTRTSTSQAA